MKKNGKKVFIILVKVLTFASVLKAIDCFTKKKTEMKKLVFMFVAIAAMSFASCGNKSNDAAPATDSDSVQVDSAAVDSTDSAATDTAAADTAAADAQ